MAKGERQGEEDQILGWRSMEQLLVDRASVAVPLDDAALSLRTAHMRVFISSVMSDLQPERRAVADAVRDLGAEPVWFEEFGGRDQDAEQAYVSEVDACDVYVGILGRRYGRQLPSGYSATHAEYLRAVERGLRISVWVLEVDDREGHQQSFVDEVRTFYVTETVSSPERLAERVAARLRKLAAEDVAPWVKLGSLVFRATSVVDNDDNVVVRAAVKDAEVAHELLSLRPAWPSHARTVRFTHRDSSTEVTVQAVSATATAGSTETVELTLQRADRQRGVQVNDMSYVVGTSTYSPDDLTEIAVRQVLFAEANPVGRFGSFAQLSDPLGPVRQAQLSEEIIRPVLRLTLVEALVGSGRAARVIALRLGPPRPGGRRLVVGWESRRRYVDTPPERREVDGTVDL